MPDTQLPKGAAEWVPDTLADIEEWSRVDDAAIEDAKEGLDPKLADILDATPEDE